MEGKSSCTESNDAEVSARKNFHAENIDKAGGNKKNRSNLYPTEKAESLRVDCEENSGDDGVSCLEALRNPLILHELFSKLSTKFLLSSVSLVNKFWNTQARRFIRNYRICQVLNGGWKSGEEFLPGHGMMAPPNRSLKKGCEFIREVDELCCAITKYGRIIPYNRLEVFIEPCLRWHCESALYPYEWEDCTPLVLKSQLKLKYLKIIWNFHPKDADCSDHKTLKALLHQTCTELQKLELRRLSVTFEQYFHDWFPAFPKLEEIVFVNVPVVRDSRNHGAQKNILRRLMDGAPNLKKVEANGLWTIESIPEEKYALLDAMEFNFSMDMDRDSFRKVLATGPKLRELNISGFTEGVHRCNSKLDRDLQKLLQDCHQSLEIIRFFGLCPLGTLSLFPFVKLTKLKVHYRLGVWTGYWTTLSSIDFERLMPRLEELQVRIITTSGYDSVYEEVPLWPDPDENWNRHGIIPRCSSLRKLTLQVEAGKLNLSLLKSVFPNVVTLALKMDRNEALDRDVMQLPEICEMWPELGELEITGDCNQLDRCYDADFCGIHEQEAEQLQRKDDVFLQLVQIVPIKPSIPTMPKLQKLLIDFNFDDHSSDSDSHLLDEYDQYDEGNFVSKVTRFVAMRGIPVASVTAMFTPGGAPDS